MLGISFATNIKVATKIRECTFNFFYFFYRSSIHGIIHSGTKEEFAEPSDEEEKYSISVSPDDESATIDSNMINIDRDIRVSSDKVARA